jgi:uncharacterized membrane protein YfcA
MDILNYLIIFVIGVFAGIFGTLVGGGSLITIPVLIFIGLSPQTAIGTNSFGITGMNIAGWYKFHGKKMINYKLGLIVGIPILIGSIIGATLVLHINEVILKKIIAVLTLSTLVLISLKPNIGVKKVTHTIKVPEYFIGVILSFFLGIYTGFYGAGAGTFLAYLLILLFKQTFLESAATRKIPFTFSSVMATLIFAISGLIVYPIGIGLFLSTSVGAYIGAHYSDRIGNVWIKRLFFVAVLLMAIKLII